MKSQFRSPWYEYLIVLIFVLLSALVCFFIQEWVGYKVLSFVLLIVVSVLAFVYNTGPVLMASALSALIWNFFFIPPHFTLHISNTEDMLMFVMFFIIALLNGVAKKAYMLGESDKLYKTLFNSVSHEFRIPVTTIMGASDTLLSEKYSEEDQQKLLQEINIASIRLNQLVENLLNISRLESGHLTVKLNWYDFQDLINKVIHRLSKELSFYELKIQVPAELPMLKIDFGLMEQVLHNLLLNITQYVPRQTLIELKVELKDNELTVWISDQGDGFPVPEIKHVFDKFYRGESKRTGGTGLGLSIVKGFVEAHHGSVKVYNQQGSGAVFEICIPVEISEIPLTE
jgi:two-component system sensor histidine kinase KdpD